MSQRVPPATSPHTLGIVVIGRNEGERLSRCLASVQAQGTFPIVFADSGSTDDSVARAQSVGAEVVALSADRPFTAARGRNAGFRRLIELQPQLKWVQFLDGDTRVQPEWLARAANELARDAGLCAVTGRRRETAPDASVYNALCDIEWDTPVGDAEVFGGDVMLRVDDFLAAGGYDETLIAGEDPDFAVRLRQMGRRILRVDAEMTLHDAAMHEFAQWWKRNVRAGHAFAECAERHRAIGFWSHEVKSNWLWGALPAAGAVLAPPTLGASLWLVAGGYAALVHRLTKYARSRGLSEERARQYAVFTALGKIPESLGQARYTWGRITQKRARIIEYK